MSKVSVEEATIPCGYSSRVVIMHAMHDRRTTYFQNCSFSGQTRMNDVAHTNPMTYAVQPAVAVRCVM